MVESLGYKVSPVGDELRIQPQHSSECAHNLRSRVVASLKTSHRGFNQRMQIRDVVFCCQAKAEFWFHCDLRIQAICDLQAFRPGYTTRG